jgi:outer membrane protein assembly factor BamB
MTHRLLLSSLLLAATVVSARDWTQWRGPNQDGSTDETGLPTKFSTTEGVSWGYDLPGAAASVPAVGGGKVFLTAPETKDQKFLGICVDEKTGKELWRKVLADGYQWDDKSNLASPSPVIDGDHVIFFFATGDLVCLGHDGSEIWKRNICKDHGRFATQWTYSSSPMLDDGRLYIQALQRNEYFVFKGDLEKGEKDRDNSSYLLAIDPKTGKDLYKTIRPSDAVSESLEAFSTPVATTHEGKRVILLTGGDVITAHDPATGAELWRSPSWNKEKIGHWRLVPSAVAGGGVALACAPKKNPVYAYKLGSKGQLQDSDAAWVSDAKDASSDVATPAFSNGFFYVLDSDRKTMSCVEPSGKVRWTGELGSKAKLEASPSVADGKIYAVNFWGQVFVVSANPDKFELLSTNEMGDGSKPGGNDNSVRAAVVPANGHLFIRSQSKLWRVGS